MRSLELLRSRETAEPAPDEASQVAKYCYEHGLITIGAGTYNNIIRLLMPLVITDAQFDEALNVLESALQFVSQGSSTVSNKEKVVHDIGAVRICPRDKLRRGCGSLL